MDAVAFINSRTPLHWSLLNIREGVTMSMMCSMQACMEKPGMCPHEKVMMGVVLVVVVGWFAYILL
jgi:hypothetical protein